MREGSPSPIPVDMEPIDWLISLRPEYASSPLATWTGRHQSNFLRNFAALKADYPELLKIASDYLFAASAPTYLESLSPITREDVATRKVNRVASMQGGFPWTDDQYPWPTEIREDGTVLHARPALQLNMRDLGTATGVKLPNVIYQVWDQHFGERTIPLEDVEGQEPDWKFPDIDALFGEYIWEAYGWSYDVDSTSPCYAWIGNLIVPEPTSNMCVANLDWCSEDIFTAVKPAWSDFGDLIRAYEGTGLDVEKLLSRVYPDVDHAEKEDFLNRRAALSEMWLQEFGNQLLNSRIPEGRWSESRRGAFGGMPLFAVGSENYHDAMLLNRRMFYEPSFRLEGDEQPGLDCFRGMGSMYVSVFDPESPLAYRKFPDEIEFQIEIGWVNG